MSNPIANRYAFALFQVAKEQKLLDQLKEELRVVKEVFNQNKNFNIYYHLQSYRKRRKDNYLKMFFLM